MEIKKFGTLEFFQIMTISMYFPHFLLHTFKLLIYAKHGLQLVMLKGAINDQDRDYQKGKDTIIIISC